MADRKANALWNGDLKSGNGNMKFGNGAFDGAFSFNTRFGEESGPNPEQLIAAAHAGCYSMALSNELDKAGHTPNSVETKAEIKFEDLSIKGSHLVVKADVPGIEENEFMRIAQDAKENCPVSRALQAIEITLDASLKS